MEAQSPGNARARDDWDKQLQGLVPEECIEVISDLREILQNESHDSEERIEAASALATQLGVYIVSLAGVAHDIAWLLEDANEDVRVAACSTLAEMGEYGVPAIEPLIKVLDDPVKEVRHEAIHALAAIVKTESESNKERVANELMRMLHIPDDPATQSFAAVCLGLLNAVSAARELEDLLASSSSRQARRAAAMSLGTLKEAPGSVARLLSYAHLEDREAGLEALELFGSQAAPYAEEVAARLCEPLLRCKAMATLGAMGEGAGAYVQTISGYLWDPDAEVRLAALEAMEQLRAYLGPDEVEAAKELLHHQDPRFRATGLCAFLAIGEEKSGQYAEAMGQFLSDDAGKDAIRANTNIPCCMRQPDLAAANALGKLGGPGRKNAARLASQCVGGSSTHARVLAMEAIGSMGEAGVAHAGLLIDCLEDTEEVIVMTALAQLGKLIASGLGTRAAASMVKAVKRMEGSLLPEGIIALGVKGAPEPIYEALISWFTANSLNPATGDESIAIAAMQALGQVGEAVGSSPQALQALKTCLSSSSQGVRRAAAETLGAIKAMCLAEQVAEKLTDYCNVRGAAAMALGHLAESGAEYQQEVAELLDSPMAMLRQTACEALGKLVEDGQALHREVLDKLQEAAGDLIPCVRKAAVKTLEGAM